MGRKRKYYEKKRHTIRNAAIVIITAYLTFHGIDELYQRNYLPEEIIETVSVLKKETGKLYSRYENEIKDKIPFFNEHTSLSMEQTNEGFDFENAEGLTVDYIDVGQGNCALIQQGDHYMLFDCAPDDKGTYVQNYLQKKGITELDYVIGSHPDEDHIGGMDVVITKFDCGMVMMPDYEKDSRTYDNVISALEYKGYDLVNPEVGFMYDFGDAHFTIIGPMDTYSDSNNNSICIRLVYGNTSFLFTGDAEKEAEEDMMESGYILSSDVYQVGHHGSSTSNTEQFISKIDPDYAVISCGENNDYGHPHKETLDTLENAGTTILRTDQDGTVVIYSDGTSCYLS